MSTTEISEDHPLSLELASLRTTAAKYQHEAHAAAVKLQRHSLETSHALEQTHALQHENARLREEIEALRAHPDTTPHPAALQVQELTLALRKLSDKLTLTEETLLSRTTELTHARSGLGNAQSNAEAAQALIAQAYTQVEQGHARERELQRKVRAAQEERRLADLVVQEYADLVRTLEGRKSKGPPSPSVAIHANASDSSITLADSLAEGKLGLQKLLGEHDTEVERLSAEVSHLAHENELLRMKLDVEKKRSEADRESLAKVLLELDKHRADDATATKMVSRYMKFSQSTIDSLQQAMDNLRTRHAATLATFSSQIEYLNKAISAEHQQAEKLRDTLDELSEDISREAYGRRREVGLRLAFLAREEGLAENLRRWSRRSRESLDRLRSQAGHDDVGLREAFEHMLHDAESLLKSLNGQPSVDADSSASLARLVAAQEAVATLTKELQLETDNRLRLQRRLVAMELSGPTDSDVPFPLSAPPPRHASLGRVSKEQAMSSDPTPAPVTTDTDVASTTPLPTHPLPQERTPDAATANDIAVPGAVELVNPTTSSPSIPLPIADQHTVTTEPISPIPPSISIEEPELPTNVVTIPDSPAHRDIFPEKVLTLPPNNEAPSRPAFEDLPLPLTPASAVAASLASPSTLLPATTLVLGPSSERHPSSLESVQAPVVGTEIESLDDESEVSPVAIGDTTAPVALEFPKHEDMVETDVSLAEQPDASSLLFSTSSPEAPEVSPKDGLIARLSQVKHRYQHLQKSFSDCNVTLKDLKKELNSLPPSADMSSVIRTAVERLDDYNEDARVELEIRIADEERIVMGYETLLSVPGALDDDMDEGKLQDDVDAFIDGSNSAVARATQQFTRKLDDLEHDIASVKRALYELADAADNAPTALTTPNKQQGWSAWTAGILGATRPVSPAPTFGSVMTTPRLRQSSFSLAHRPSPPVDSSASRSPGEDGSSPFASLGLRIAMPIHAASAATPVRPFLSPMSSMSRGLRPRVSSTSLFGLGLGARSSSFTFGTPGSSKSPSSGLAKSAGDDTEDSDSDIE